MNPFDLLAERHREYATARDRHARAVTKQAAAQELDGMPAARRGDWLPQAKRDFEAARGDYEKRLAGLIEAYERVEQEAALVGTLAGGQAFVLAHILNVHVSGVEGEVREVPVADVLAALRGQLYDLEAKVLIGAME